MRVLFPQLKCVFISLSYDQMKLPPLVFLDMNILGILANTFERPIEQRSFYQVPGESGALLSTLEPSQICLGSFWQGRKQHDTRAFRQFLLISLLLNSALELPMGFNYHLHGGDQKSQSKNPQSCYLAF